MGNIKITVIMPIYNSGSYLKMAVESILNQSLKEIELILVDDGSTDGSSERCDKFAQSDSRVKVIHQKNGGICSARNMALSIAQGEYIAFSDHDDEYKPELLRKSYENAKQNDADIVKFGKVEHILIGERIVRTKSSHYPIGFYGKNNIIQCFWNLWESDVICCVWDGIYRSDVIRKNNIQFNAFYKNGGEDIDYMLRLIAKVSKLSIMPGIYYIHYIRKGFSTSSKFNEYNLTTSKSFPDKMNECLSQLGINKTKMNSEYSYFLLLSLYGVIINILANPACEWTKKNKIYFISNMSEKYPMSFSIVSFCYALKRSNKYFLLKFFLFFHMYSSCLKLYRYRNK